MKKSQAKLFGSIAGSVMLAGAGMSAFLPVATATADTTENAITSGESTDSSQLATQGIQSVENVEGTFSYSQDIATSNSDIANVFNKAASSHCASLPEYVVTSVKSIIQVTGGTSFEASVSDMQADEAAESVLIACACASNLAGGGAVANAKVSGVTLASIAAMAQAR